MMAVLDTPYNLTKLNSAETVWNLWDFVNSVTGGLFSAVAVLSIFFIALISLVWRGTEFDQALLVSSFGAFIISAVLTYAELLNLLFPLMFLAILAFTAFYVFVVKN